MPETDDNLSTLNIAFIRSPHNTLPDIVFGAATPEKALEHWRFEENSGVLYFLSIDLNRPKFAEFLDAYGEGSKENTEDLTKALGAIKSLMLCRNFSSVFEIILAATLVLGIEGPAYRITDSPEQQPESSASPGQKIG